MTPADYRTALWRTQTATSGDCRTAEQNWIGAAKLGVRQFFIDFTQLWVPLSSVGSARPMCRGSAADPGSTPGLGPFAAWHSPSLTLFPVTLFSLYYQ